MTFKRVLSVCVCTGLALAFALQAPLAAWAAGAWQWVGSAGFSAGGITYTSLALDKNNTPYVAYADASLGNKATVMTYTGTAWHTVGSAGFSAGQADYVSLALDSSGTPYVAYTDGGNSRKATVMKYTGSGATGWVAVGSAGFTAGEADYVSLALDSGSGIPVVAFQDWTHSKKATLMQFTGGAWGVVGTAGFSAGQADDIGLALGFVMGDATVPYLPYVVYKDIALDSRATLMCYAYGISSRQWATSAAFSAGHVDDLSLIYTGQLYVAYSDGANGSKVTVMQIIHDNSGGPIQLGSAGVSAQSASWAPLGSAGFSAGAASSVSLAVDSIGTVYVAYIDAGNGNRVTVMKYTGAGATGWVPVGPAGLSAGTANSVSLAVANVPYVMPYVAFSDGSNSAKATVMKAPSGTFTVSSLADTTTASPSLTLRDALLVARGGTGAAGLNRAVTPGEQAALGGCVFSSGFVTDDCGADFPETIVFASSLGVNPVIHLTAPLPDLADTVPTVIDGMANGVYPVLSAEGLASGADALHITSDRNTLQGLTLTGAPQDDLTLIGSRNQVTSTRLFQAGRYGLYVPGGSLNTLALVQVGAAGAGNGQGGIVLDNGAMTNTITSTVVAGNTGNGIALLNGATQNGIISSTLIGNSQNGLLISGAATTLNGVHCDYFGITPQGVPAGNGGYGVRLSAGTTGNLFESAVYTDVSANALGGVRLDTGAQGNYVAGHISLNAGPGVEIDSAPDNILGFVFANYQVCSGRGSSIVGNLGPGVLVTNSTGTQIIFWVTEIGNNTGPGVELVNSSHTLVGPSFISGNGGAGVAVEGTASTNNSFLPFAIQDNGGLPVDLGNDGPTLNGAHTPPGPNDWLPYPVITAFSGSVVTGTTCLNCTVFIDQAQGNPVAPGGGAMSLSQTVLADGAGRWHATLSGGLTPATITLQACQGTCPTSSTYMSPPVGSDMSEFSPLLSVGTNHVWLPYVVR
jgi:hypothetical protein